MVSLTLTTLCVYSKNTHSTLARLATEMQIITMIHKRIQKATILVLEKRKHIAIARCWKEVFVRLLRETYLNRRAPFCFQESMCNSEGSWELIPCQSFPRCTAHQPSKPQLYCAQTYPCTVFNIHWMKYPNKLDSLLFCVLLFQQFNTPLGWEG